MRKKSRLHEFEKNNRVINIEQAQAERRARLAEQKERQQALASGQTGRKKRRINYVRLLIVIGILFLLINFGVSAGRIWQLRQEKEQVEAYNLELLQRREALTAQLENVLLPEYIESLAREDLKLVKGNELLFIFPEEDILTEGKGQAAGPVAGSGDQNAETDGQEEASSAAKEE